uniref:Uncharacterized protein n=1 Tax=Picea sitchensis TaxID=3332 RepID=A9NUB0_PICSI|nr:unknown [Picea sitchensis]
MAHVSLNSKNHHWNLEFGDTLLCSPTNFSLFSMTRSLLHMKVVTVGALSRFGNHGFGLGSDLPIQTMREYSVVAGKVELSARLIQADPKQGDDKAGSGYRQRSWMPDPVTGYYIPEDHFGESDIAELRENILKNHSATSRRGPN